MSPSASGAWRSRGARSRSGWRMRWRWCGSAGWSSASPQLSGGQQQRVALARALVTRAEVLLLDEPLGALDKRLRQQMQIELKRIQREVGITTIFVTHDQEEALTLSDRIAIFDEAGSSRPAPPMEVYERPATAFAANFLGDANFFEGKVLGPGRVAAEGGELATDDPLPATGSTVILAVRPEKIFLARPESPATPGNRLMGQFGAVCVLRSACMLRARVGRPAGHQLRDKAGRRPVRRPV